jgi:toxin ParE1/3/4
VSPTVLKRPKAKQDLLDHFVYIDEHNPAAAERFLDAAESAFNRLAQFPRMGRRWDSPLPHLAELRSWTLPRFRNYRIFYRPLDDGIEVVRVLYARRDLQKLLDDQDEVDG